MEAFTTFTGIVAPYFHPDVDTDKIIPHRYLRKPLSAGYRNFLFYDERFTPEGTVKPDFILHRAPYDKAGILVSGANFGCGSTREGAIYALADFGFRAVIATSFGDVFYANCLQNGLLPVVLPDPIVAELAQSAVKRPGVTVTIDLPAQTVTTPDGRTHRFEIDAARKTQLLRGLDDIGITLEEQDKIDRFEAEYHRRLHWLPISSA
ncbi:MAG: 3-isopropylmalate dehydratase small subunit [Burkholderiales bacterium]|nr:3-isopropylmalate dehydratase small subunit [Burkholderiales bacterium]